MRIGQAITAFGLLWAAAAAPAGDDAAGTSIKRIYVLPMSHLDVGFTDAPSAVAEKMAAMVDKALDQADADPDYVFNIETFWQLDQWLATRPDADRRQRLVRLVRAGRFGVGAAYVTPHTSIMSAWALGHLCEPARSWARDQGLELDWVILDDVPGHPPDLPRFLARAGIKYLVMGINQSFNPPLDEKYCNTPFWWEAPTGERVLAWISADGYTESYTRMGFDPDAARLFARERFSSDDPLAVMRKGIEEVTANYAKRGYAHDAILALHAFDNWGVGTSPRLPRFARMWNEAGQGPEIIVSTPAAFFRDLLDRDDVQIPVYRGGFGGQWERVKIAVPTSIRKMRAAEEQLRRAEARAAGGVKLADKGTDGETPAGSAEPRAPVMDASAAEAALRTYLVLCGHTFGLGPGWPGLLTEEQMLRHNREQAEMVRSLPGSPQPWPTRGTPAPLAVESDGSLEPNGLYLANGIGIWSFVGHELKPLPGAAWTALPPRRSDDGTWQFRHRINRRELGEGVQVVWAWPLKTPAEKLRPRVRTASGWMQIPDDLLDGQFHGGWYSPWATRVDGVEIAADVPLMFCVSPEHHPGWLFALCLTQSREAKFKGGAERRLTFEEAYPGEEAVLELTIEVRGQS